MNLDPLAENYYFDSPYVYTTNNPILYIDPDGRYWVRTVGENGTITYTAGKGDSAWSLYEQHGKTDGFSAAQADEMVQGQLRPNYVRKSDGMEMSNVEIGDVLKIYSGEKASDDMVITNTNENEFDPNVELLYEVPNFGLLGDLTGVNKAIQDMDVGLDIYEAEGIEAYTYYQIGIAKMEITYERMAGSPSSAVRGRGRAGRKGSTTSKGKTTSSSSGGKKTNSNSSGAGTSIKPGHTKTGQTVSVSGQNMDVIAGPQGGKYYINRNGTRVSLNRDGTKRK